jgi:uncharacterized membrane protein
MKYFLNRWHALAFITAFLICTLGIWWEWQGAPVRTGGTWLVLKVLPLALCLKGVWQARLYTLQIVSMLILLYMCEGVIRGMGDKGASQYYAWLQFCLSWACFMGCLGHVRPYKQAYKHNKRIQ